jgi:hypothetical protein
MDRTNIMDKKKIALAGCLLMAGCATLPSGPSVAVMPAPGKPFEVFMAEEQMCRDYAQRSLGTNVNDIGANNVLSGAAVGTAVGAAAGALVNGQQGAGAGAGMGLLAGAAMGSGNAGMAQGNAQRRYDIAYEQCMYAKGNQLPTASAPSRSYYSAPPAYQPPPSYNAPPPPPSSYNAPPPPPSGQPAYGAPPSYNAPPPPPPSGQPAYNAPPPPPQ